MKRVWVASGLVLLSVALLTGCATTGKNLLSHSSSAVTDIQPTPTVVETQLAGRAYTLGSVAMDIKREYPQEDHPLSDEAYLKLMENQLVKAFSSSAAALGSGIRPPCRVDVAVEDRRFTAGQFLFPKPSVLYIRLSVYGPDGTLALRGGFKSLDSSAVTVFLGPGMIAPVAVPRGTALMAHSRLIPAMAALVTKLVKGLQEGKTLEQIVLFPEEGGYPRPEYVLKHQDLGLSPLTVAETEAITGMKIDLK